MGNWLSRLGLGATRVWVQGLGFGESGTEGFTVNGAIDSSLRLARLHLLYDFCL